MGKRKGERVEKKRWKEEEFDLEECNWKDCGREIVEEIMEEMLRKEVYGKDRIGEM